MDYFKTVKESFNIWWKNKYLWILGIIAVVFGGGNSSSTGNLFSNNYNSTGIGNNSTEISPVVYLIIAIICCIGLIIILVGIYLKSRSDASLISSIPLIEKKTVLGFKKSWNLSVSKWVKLFLLNLIISFPILIVVLLSTILIIIVLASSSQIDPNIIMLIITFIGIPLVCIIILYSLFAKIIYTFSSRISVLNEIGLWESIKKGWSFFTENFSNILVFWLIDLAIGVVTGPILAVIGFVILIPLALMVIPLYIVNFWLGIIVSLVFVFLIGALLSILSGPIYTFGEIYWTKVYLTLKKENA